MAERPLSTGGLPNAAAKGCFRRPGTRNVARGWNLESTTGVFGPYAWRQWSLQLVLEMSPGFLSGAVVAADVCQKCCGMLLAFWVDV
jgi:hypothetical protein